MTEYAILQPIVESFVATPAKVQTQGVVFVTVHAPTTVETYLKRLRPPREKRPHGRP